MELGLFLLATSFGLIPETGSLSRPWVASYSEMGQIERTEQNDKISLFGTSVFAILLRPRYWAIHAKDYNFASITGWHNCRFKKQLRIYQDWNSGQAIQRPPIGLATFLPRMASIGDRP